MMSSVSGIISVLGYHSSSILHHDSCHHYQIQVPDKQNHIASFLLSLLSTNTTLYSFMCPGLSTSDMSALQRAPSKDSQANKPSSMFMSDLCSIRCPPMQCRKSLVFRPGHLMECGMAYHFLYASLQVDRHAKKT